MASPVPERVTTDHTGSPEPKPAKGVKLAMGVAGGVVALLLLTVWAIVHALK